MLLDFLHWEMILKEQHEQAPLYDFGDVSRFVLVENLVLLVQCMSFEDWTECDTSVLRANI